MVAFLAQQNAKMVALLPPTGTEVFRRFTLESLAEIERRMAEEAEEQERKKALNIEVHLTFSHFADTYPDSRVTLRSVDLNKVVKMTIYHSQAIASKTFFQNSCYPQNQCS